MNDMDRRVVALVAALNSLPGVATFSSCGGHDNPGLCQAAADSFYVAFDIKPTRAGWRSLALLTWVSETLSKAEPPFSVIPWWNGDDEWHEECLCFEVFGDRNADPDAIAKAIRRAGRRLP